LSSSSYRRHSHCCIVVSLLHCHFIVSSLSSSDPHVIVVVVAVIELSYHRRNQLRRRFVLPCRVDCGVRCVGLVGGVETVDRGALVVVGVHSAYSIAIAAGSAVVVIVSIVVVGFVVPGMRSICLRLVGEIATCGVIDPGLLVVGGANSLRFCRRTGG